MTRPVTAPTITPDPPRCPFCGEKVLIDRDELFRCYVCRVCARTWSILKDGE
jgi:DNA-directed RNA polymerase subunit RPC12/RpoP